MTSFPYADIARSKQPLQVSLEVLANLIYLAGRTETHSAQQSYYLDWAATILRDLQHHPKLRDEAHQA